MRRTERRATTSQASTNQFIGGTVAQSVTGATLDSIVYGYTDGTKTAVNLITLTFAGTLAVPARTVTVNVNGNGDAVDFTCAIDDGSGDATAQKTSVCSPVGVSVTNLTGVAVTVA